MDVCTGGASADRDTEHVRRAARKAGVVKRTATGPVRSLGRSSRRLSSVSPATPATACSSPATQFTDTSALRRQRRHHASRLPRRDPRAAGTLAGVSAFQVHFADYDIFTPGDEVDILVAMNPAALKTNISDLNAAASSSSTTTSSTEANLDKAGYEANPLEDGSARRATSVVKVPMTTLDARRRRRHRAVARRTWTAAKNLFALGLVYWLYGRPLEPTRRFIQEKFAKKPEDRRGQRRERSRPATTTAKPPKPSHAATRSRRPSCPPATYRKITGNEALASAWSPPAKLSGNRLVLRRRYPITPAIATSCTSSPSTRTSTWSRPGRGRDRRDRRGHRRLLRRSARRHRHLAARASR